MMTRRMSLLYVEEEFSHYCRVRSLRGGSDDYLQLYVKPRPTLGNTHEFELSNARLKEAERHCSTVNKKFRVTRHTFPYTRFNTTMGTHRHAR